MTSFTNKTKNQNPTKILFFIESLYQGGRERQLVELLKQLTKEPNFECELVTMRKDIFYTDILKFGINIHVIERKLIKKDPFVFFKFYNVAKHFNPDIVHVWGPMTAVYSLFAKMILNFKLLNFQIQDAPVKPHFGIINHKVTFHFSDLIIANSTAGLKTYSPPLDKSKIIYNGFDFERIQNITDKSKIRKKYGINTKYTVAMIARFAKDKDYISYIQAANMILSDRKDVSFLCIGNLDSEKYKKLVESGNADKIKFYPQQTDIESIMNICDIGILSTFTEGISNVVMEFMALGKPVIATDGGGTAELVIDGETGYLIPPKSPEILSEKIQYLLDNPDIAKKLGKNGSKRIRKEFNIGKMVNEFVGTYQELVNA